MQFSFSALPRYGGVSEEACGDVVPDFNMVRRLCVVVLLVSCAGCGHPWFKSGKKASVESPVIVGPDATGAGATDNVYLPGTPTWVPLIDECIRRGQSRNDCINELPQEELAALKQWEQEMGQRRRERLQREPVPKLGADER